MSEREATRPRLPDLVRPMLAIPGELPPASEDARWAYEMKWDGVRAIGYVQDGTTRLLSRNDLDISVSYPEALDAPEPVQQRSLVPDRELVALDERGRPSFGRLQERMHVRDPAAVRRLAGRVPVFPLRLRPASPGRPPAPAAAVHRAPRPARRPRAGHEDVAGTGQLPRARRGRDGRQRAARPGGHRGQAPSLAVPARAAVPRLAQGQAPADAGRRHRRWRVMRPGAVRRGRSVLLRGQECGQRGQHLLGSLLGDEVAPVGKDHGLHVVRREPHRVPGPLPPRSAPPIARTGRVSSVFARC
jgi:ATP dependent DNA ligase-like protein